jgi:hypothetical protein
VDEVSTVHGVPFDKLCRVVARPAPVAEYAFAAHLGRRWRFDWAWAAQQIALEVEGGSHTNGRHTRHAGFVGDMQKYNCAQLEGWIVLRVIPADLESTTTFDLIRRALALRKAATHGAR